jgi:hypothetical protein
MLDKNMRFVFKILKFKRGIVLKPHGTHPTSHIASFFMQIFKINTNYKIL